MSYSLLYRIKKLVYVTTGRWLGAAIPPYEPMADNDETLLGGQIYVDDVITHMNRMTSNQHNANNASTPHSTE